LRCVLSRERQLLLMRSQLGLRPAVTFVLGRLAHWTAPSESLWLSSSCFCV
jgi:hypothetical protein